MKQYIAGKFDKVAGSLTADDCGRVILENTDDPQLADNYSNTVAGYEALRYASVQINIDTSKIKQVTELINSIEKRSRK